MAVAELTRPRYKPRRRTELGLLALASLVVVFADILAGLGLHRQLPGNLDVVAAFTVGLALAGHLANRFLVPAADPVLFPVAVLLNGLGWVVIDRLSVHLGENQAGWSVVGMVVYILTLVAVRRPRELERFRYILVAVGLVLLLLPLAPKLGEQINGARLWIHVGPLSFQPVELAKICLVVFFASWFVEKRELLVRPTARLGNLLVPDPRAFGPVLAAWGFSMLAMTAERNVGFAMLIFVIFLSMLWMATGRVGYLAIGVVLFALGAFVGVHLFAQVSERITDWLDPWKDATGSGYQIVQAQYALGSGGLAGTGLGLGSPALVPVAYSDFIFSSVGEELGLLGTTSVVIAFVLLIGSGLRLALRARTEFAKLVAAGLTVVLGFQAFFIMAGVVRLLPLTGVDLPFVAYGGSSLVANYLLLALLGRISDDGERPPASTEP